jgi:TPR repeat protein
MEAAALETFQLYKAAADGGDAHGLLQLGHCYMKGEGVRVNKRRARDLYREAADKGLPEAMFVFGAFCQEEQCQGEKKEDIQYLTAAAKKGYAPAQYLLGRSYLIGKGVDIDVVKAFELMKLAADQGVLSAQIHLGQLLSVKKEFQHAFQYFQMASDQGSAEGQFLMGSCYEKGFGVERDMKKAFELYKLSAEQGFVKSQVSLAFFFSTGIENVVEKEPAQALHYYQLADCQGCLAAKYDLGVMYFEGNGVKRNLRKAMKFWNEAADFGFPKAYWHLGKCHEEGQGVPKDSAEAFKFYKLAAQAGHPGSQVKVADFYQTGLSMKRKDLHEAAKYYEMAACNGHAGAQAQIACMYEQGIGTKKNIDGAIEMYVRSANQGVSGAQKWLQEKLNIKSSQKNKKSPSETLELIETFDRLKKVVLQALRRTEAADSPAVLFIKAGDMCKNLYVLQMTDLGENLLLELTTFFLCLEKAALVEDVLMQGLQALSLDKQDILRFESRLRPVLQDETETGVWKGNVEAVLNEAGMDNDNQLLVFRHGFIVDSVADQDVFAAGEYRSILFMPCT